MKKPKHSNSPAANANPAAAPPFDWGKLLPLAAIIIAFVIYGPSLSGPFVYDDQYLPFRDAGYAKLPFSAWLAGVRPMLMASYWMNFQISGLETTSYHVLNVLLHACNAILAGLAVRKIAQSSLLAAVCGGIFLVHPLQTEAVSYVASRSENLTVFFYLSAFVLFLHSAGAAFPRALAILALFGAACLSKEYAVTLPALMLLTDWWFGNWKQNWRIYAPIAVAALAGSVFVFRVLSQSDTAGFGLRDLSPAAYFFTQCRAIWVYAAKFVLPAGLNIDHDFPVSQSLMDHGAVFGLLALLAVSGAAFWFRKQYPLASYGWFAFLILLAPTSSIVPIRDVLVERRAYLPALGLLFVLAELLRRVKIPAAAFALPLLLLAGATYQRNTLWADPLALWQDAAEKSPRKWRVQFQVADALYRKGECAAAAAAFEKTHPLDKPDYRLLINWAHALDCAGQAQPALQRAQEAARIEGTGQAYALIGMLYAKANRLDEAMTALNQAIATDPRFDPAYLYRGNVHFMRGDQAAAAADYQKALELNPANEQASRGLSRANRR